MSESVNGNGSAVEVDDAIGKVEKTHEIADAASPESARARRAAMEKELEGIAAREAEEKAKKLAEKESQARVTTLELTEGEARLIYGWCAQPNTVFGTLAETVTDLRRKLRAAGIIDPKIVKRLDDPSTYQQRGR